MIIWQNNEFNANAEQCYNEIKSLTNVNPENVLKLARSPDTELHKCFCWDDVEAAEKYRLIQAEHVIRFLVVKDDDQKDVESVKNFTIVNNDGNQIFTPIIFSYQQKDQHSECVQKAINELIKIYQKYSSIKELENVMNAIKEIM